MRERLLLDPELADGLADAGLCSAGDLLSLAGTGTEHNVGTFVDLPVAGTAGRFYLKRYHYAGWKASKGLLGRGTLWGSAPEVAEFRALRWLRGHDVPAVRPVAAAMRTQRGRLVGHALLTEAVPGAHALDARLFTPGDPLRESFHLRRRLARVIGAALRRMHGGGFIHRDCHARNVLARLEDGDVRIWFLDCRRARVPPRNGSPGGERHERARNRRRRAARLDLATLDHDLQGLLTRGERRCALTAYLGEDRGTAGDVIRQVAGLRARLRAPRRPQPPAV